MLGHGCFDLLFIYLVSCFVGLFSVLFRLQLSVVGSNRSSRSQVVRIELLKIFSFGLAVLKTILVRRRTKTQKYKGALFEQLESGWT